MNYAKIDKKMRVKIALKKWVKCGFRIYHSKALQKTKFIKRNFNYYHFGYTDIKGINCMAILAVYKAYDLFKYDFETNDFWLDAEVKMKTMIFDSNLRKNEIIKIDSRRAFIFKIPRENLRKFFGEAHILISDLEQRAIEVLFVINPNQRNGAKVLEAINHLASLNDNRTNVNISFKYSV